MLGVGSNVLVQVVIFGAQFLIVPVLALSWGLERYGTWLMLSTIPAYLALGDLGLGTAASNQMTMEVARGREDLARDLFQHTFTLTLAAAMLLVAAGSAVAALVPLGSTLTGSAGEGELRLALGTLCAYGTVCLMFSLPNGSLKAVGLYHLSGLAMAFTMMVEALTACAVVLLGGDFFHVALGYLAVRTCTMVVLYRLLRQRAPWVKLGLRCPTRDDVSRLIPPALSVLAFTGAQALVFQGSTLVIGLAASSAVVAGFTTVRTLTRLGVQAVVLVNRAVMPEFSRAWAQGNVRAVRSIVRTTILSSVAVTLPIAVLLVLFGDWFVRRWTGGVVDPDATLLYLMVAVMLANALWTPASGLLLAVNRQSSFSYRYTALAAASLTLSYFLCQGLGATGAAVGLLCLDLTMCAIVVPRLLRIARTLQPSD